MSIIRLEKEILFQKHKRSRIYVVVIQDLVYTIKWYLQMMELWVMPLLHLQAVRRANSSVIVTWSNQPEGEKNHFEKDIY